MHWKLTDNQRLLTAIMLADTPDLLQNLLIDLLTQDEFNACATRLTTMCLLHDGASYKEIQNITGMSSKTIKLSFLQYKPKPFFVLLDQTK